MKKINSKGFSSLEIILIVVIIGIIGSVGYTLYKNKPSSDVVLTTQQQTSNLLTTKQIVEAAKTKVAKEQTSVRIQKFDYEYNGTVSFHIGSYDFVTIANAQDYVAFELISSESSKSNVDFEAAQQKDIESLKPTAIIVTELLTGNGFTEVKDYPAKDLMGEGSKAFERTQDICTVSSIYSVAISCVPKSKLVAAAKEVKPFVTAYQKTSKDSPAPGMAFGLVKYGTGATKDDKYAHVSLGYAGAYFYQDNNEWVYIGSTQEGIGCDEAILVNNPKAKAALANVCRPPGEGL